MTEYCAKMVYTVRKIRLTVILISAWTITQSVLHLFWITAAYLLATCQIRPQHYDLVFVYLTYFYKKSCGPIHLSDEAYFAQGKSLSEDVHQNETGFEVLLRFVRATLHNATLPPQSYGVNRTEMYLMVFIVVDVLWIMAAMILSVAAFYKSKQSYLSVLFYGPWILCSAIVNFLDVVTSVHYGVDLIYIQSYTSWLHFIGVTNYKEFQSFNSHPSSTVIPAMPTTVVVSILSKVFLGWLINVICFFVILFLAIPNMFVRTTGKPTLNHRISKGSIAGINSTGEILDFNSSEARIRNWQLFYGAIEANSTLASDASVDSEANFSIQNDKAKEAMGTKMDNDKTFVIPHMIANLEQKSSHGFEDSGYRRYSDVAFDVPGLPILNGNKTNQLPTCLKSHVPWTCMGSEEHRQQHHISFALPEEGNKSLEEKCLTYCTRL